MRAAGIPAVRVRGSGSPQATAYRYKDEAVQVPAARAPSLREALDKAVKQGLPYLILDGTLVSSDRCANRAGAGVLVLTRFEHKMIS